MAKITLNYDPKNIAAKKLLQGILSTNFFKVESLPKKKKLSGIEQGIEDLKLGKIHTYNNSDELFKKFQQ